MSDVEFRPFHYPAHPIEKLDHPRRKALLQCYCNLVRDAANKLIYGLQTLSAARDFAIREGMFDHAEDQFEDFVDIGYRVHRLQLRLETLSDRAARGVAVFPDRDPKTGA